MDVCSPVGVRMCCSGVRTASLEHVDIVFYLEHCVFSCDITGTWSKSNGPNVSGRAGLSRFIHGYRFMVIYNFFCFISHALKIKSFRDHALFEIAYMTVE